MFYLYYLYLFTSTGVQCDFHIMVFLSFNSNTTGATCGAGTNNPCGATFLRASTIKIKQSVLT